MSRSLYTYNQSDEPSSPKVGQLWYNPDTDSTQFYTDNGWFESTIPRSGSVANHMYSINKDMFDIGTLSNAVDWGSPGFSLSPPGYSLTLGSASTEGIDGRGLIFQGGSFPTSNINSFNVTNSADGTSYGSLEVATTSMGTCTNESNGRLLCAGGTQNRGDRAAAHNVIEYAQITTTGTASDFGDLAFAVRLMYGMSNGVNDRAAFMGGSANGSNGARPGGGQYTTISTLSDATLFGDLIVPSQTCASCSAGTRGYGLTLGGRNSRNSPISGIELTSIDALSNSTAFGNLQNAGPTAGTSNGSNERAVAAIGNGLTTYDYVNMATFGDATTFGARNRITFWAYYNAMTSNA